MASEAENSWKFAQCFGDKGEVEDITEGKHVIKAPVGRISGLTNWLEEQHAG